MPQNIRTVKFIDLKYMMPNLLTLFSANKCVE